MGPTLIFATAPEAVLQLCVSHLRKLTGEPIDIVATSQLRDRAGELFAHLGFREILPVNSHIFTETLDMNLLGLLQERQYGRVVVLFNNAALLGYQNVFKVVDFANTDCLMGFESERGLWDMEKALTLSQPDHRFYVISFPRSGNTWLMESLALLLGMKPCEALETTSVTQYQHRMAADGSWQSLRSDAFTAYGMEEIDAQDRAAIKSHSRVNTYRRLYPRGKIIYIVRDVRDALTSLYFFAFYRKRRFKNDAFNAEHFRSYIISAARSWVSHVSNWRRFPGVLLVRYEDMYADYRGQMQRIVNFVGLEPTMTAEDAQAALENRRSKRFSGKPNDFYRKGIIGDYQNYFTPELHQTVLEITGEEMRSLGYKI